MGEKIIQLMAIDFLLSNINKLLTENEIKNTIIKQLKERNESKFEDIYLKLEKNAEITQTYSKSMTESFNNNISLKFEHFEKNFTELIENTNNKFASFKQINDDLISNLENNIKEINDKINENINKERLFENNLDDNSNEINLIRKNIIEFEEKISKIMNLLKSKNILTEEKDPKTGKEGIKALINKITNLNNFSDFFKSMMKENRSDSTNIFNI